MERLNPSISGISITTANLFSDNADQIKVGYCLDQLFEKIIKVNNEQNILFALGSEI